MHAETLQKLLNNSLEIICTIDETGQIVWINEATFPVLGFTAVEMIGKQFIDFVVPNDQEKSISAYKDILKGTSITTFESTCWRKDGTTSKLNWSVLWSEEQKLIYCIAKDSTNQSRLRQLLDAATKMARIGSWEVDLINNTVYWSDITREIYEIDEHFNPTLEKGISYYREDYREFVTEQVMNCIQHGTPFDFEVPLITAKGNLCWVRAIGQPEFKDGKCVRIFGSYQDVHDRKITELRLQNTADNIPGAIFQFVLKPDGSDQLLNLTKGSIELWGMEPDDCMADTSKVWQQFKDGGDYDKVIESMQMSAFTLKPWFCQWRSLRPDGKLRWHEGNGRPQKLADGSILWDSVIIDITDKKLAETELRQLNIELAERARQLAVSNADLEQFAYVASHDLQEPLRMVTSFLAQLEKKYGPELDDKAKQYIYFAVDGAQRMRQIILDLLDYSRAGSTDENLTEIDLNSVVKEIWALQSKLVVELNAKIKFDNLPKIRAHRTPIKQIIQNLINNALKYTRDGVQPIIEISANDQPDEWTISVKDNGIGIDPDYFDKIFVIFQRLHTQKEHEGTGIGLAVVKKLVENHGGRIWVDSVPDKGSTFYFTIRK